MKRLLNIIANKSKTQSKSIKDIKIIDSDIHNQISSSLKLYETRSNIHDFYLIVNTLFDKKLKNPLELTKKQEKSYKNKENIKKSMSSSPIPIINTSFGQEKTLFFNKFSEKIIKNSSNDVILNVATTAFVGSTDIPKEVNISLELLEYKLKEEKIKNENKGKEGICEMEFYYKYFKSQIVDNVDRKGSSSSFLNSLSLEKTVSSDSYYKEKYIYARDLFKFLYILPENDEVKREIYKSYNITNNKKRNIYKQLLGIFDQTSISIYESHFYMGLIYKHGLSGEVDLIKAYIFFSLAASKFHAISLYELYEMVKSNQVDFLYNSNNNANDQIKKKAILEYLLLSAEEGYTTSMYILGNEYIKGELIQKSYYKALAWHRQACKDGYFLSYEVCGDLLNVGGNDLKPDKVLALGMYTNAFYILRNVMKYEDLGASEENLNSILRKIKDLTEELKGLGEIIPELYNIDLKNSQKI